MARRKQAPKAAEARPRGAQDPEPPKAAVRPGEPDAPDAPGDQGDPGRATLPDWRPLFVGRTPEELLGLVVEGDPLGLRERTAARLNERAWLIAADRVVLRTVARIARAAPAYRGVPDLAEWVGLAIDDAVLDLLREDVEAEAAAREPGQLELGAYVALAEPLGLAPVQMRRVCIAFNALDEGVRAAFQAWVVQGRTLSEAARALELPEARVAERAKQALEAILAAESDEGPALEPRERTRPDTESAAEPDRASEERT